MYRFLVFLHIFGAILFYLGHGATALAMFDLRRHREPAAIRALMRLRVTQIGTFGVGGLMMVIPAIILGFMGDHWGRGWMWGSTVIFILIWGVMGALGRSYYDSIEMALDPQGERAVKAKNPETRSLEAVLESGRPWLLAWVGIGGTAVILWLMLYKPF